MMTFTLGALAGVVLVALIAGVVFAIRRLLRAEIAGMRGDTGRKNPTLVAPNVDK